MTMDPMSLAMGQALAGGSKTSHEAEIAALRARVAALEAMLRRVEKGRWTRLEVRALLATEGGDATSRPDRATPRE